jgi:hypothetical protein
MFYQQQISNITGQNITPEPEYGAVFITSVGMGTWKYYGPMFTNLMGFTKQKKDLFINSHNFK